MLQAKKRGFLDMLSGGQIRLFAALLCGGVLGHLLEQRRRGRRQVGAALAVINAFRAWDLREDGKGFFNGIRF